MLVQDLGRDLRIGLRILAKEKAFSALAVTVLALGIGGVATMFSVVNGVMLRGFSFPNADRLISVNFVDPGSADLLRVQRAGVRDGLRGAAAAAEVVRAAGRLHQRVDRQPHRRRPAASATPAPTSPRTSCACSASSPLMGRDLTAADNAGAPRRSRSSATASGSVTSAARADIVGKAVRINGKPATHRRRDAARVRVPDERGAVDPALQRVPGAAAERSARHQPGRPRRASAPASRSTRPTRSWATFAKRFAAAYPDTNKSFDTAQVQPLIVTFTPRPLRGHAADHARLLRRRAADRLRQRDEHAVRARDAARAGAGRPLLARRDAARGWCGRCSPRACCWPPSAPPSASAWPRSSVGLAVRGDSQPANPSAGLDPLRHRRRRARLHRGGHAGGGGRFGPAAGLDVVARGRGRRAQGGRPRQHQPQRRHA